MKCDETVKAKCRPAAVLSFSGTSGFPWLICLQEMCTVAISFFAGQFIIFFLYLLEDWTSGYSLTKSNTGKTWSPSGAQSPQHHKTTLSKRKDASVHSVTVDSHLSALWRLTQSIVAVLVPSEEANVSEFEEVFTTHLVLTWRSKIGFSYWCDKIGILEAGWMESWTCLIAAECVDL